MKSASQIRTFLLERISYIYQRPLMFGDRPESVDLILWYNHELIAYIDSDEEDIQQERKLLDDAHESVAREIECPGAMCFGTFCRQQRVNESEAELAHKIVELWKRVDNKLNKSA